MHGTSSVSSLKVVHQNSRANDVQVIDAMQPWKNESQFGDFIAEQSTFPTAPPSPLPNSNALTQPRKQDLEALQRAYGQLEQVESVLMNNKQNTKAISDLMAFVRGIRKVTPSHTASQRFEMLNPLRGWLFWVPVMYLQQARGNPYALVTLAYYYTVALVVEPIFPELGAAYFGSLSLGPIEEIARRLFSLNVSQSPAGTMQTPLDLIEYPIDMVHNFRARMGWQQPQRTASFPVFQHSTYDMSSNVDTSNVYGFGNNPAFSYSQEHLSPVKSEPPSAISPLSLDPFSGSNHYLGIPSPNGFGGYHSPSGSSFGDIAYSDQGGDDYLYEGQGSSFGGFVPHTVWI
jgi:hypothetical protein